jgi:hypothetical protein
MRIAKIVIVIFTCCVAVISSSLSASAETTRTLYVYLSRDQKWCGLSDLKTFRDRVHSNAASEFEVDQGSVEFVDNQVTKIEEFRTNEEAEGSLLVRYSLHLDGRVSAAQVSLRDVDSKTDQVVSYRVQDGHYSKLGSSKIKDIDFRRAISAASFPFFGLITVFQSRQDQQEICF